MKRIIDSQDKDYICEIKLPEELMRLAKYFANQWNEELDLCIQRTLKSGLIARRQTKEKHREELYKALEETEERLKDPL